jgi:small subunit ribosomal protein S1
LGGSVRGVVFKESADSDKSKKPKPDRRLHFGGRVVIIMDADSTYSRGEKMDLSDNSVLVAEEATGGGGRETLLDGVYDYRALKQGEVVEGHVMRITPNEVLVDVGSKAEGVVPGRELQRLQPEVLEELKVGAEVLAYVLTPEDPEGNILLSLSRAQLERDWRLAEARLEAEEMFETTITGFNKGGLLVQVGRVRGFLPASQVDRSHWDSKASDQDRGERLAQMVGQQVQLKIIELDRARNRLIVSERAALSQHRREQKGRLLSQLQEGETRHGVVTNLCDFGAFVDLGGADGLVHLSELSWKRVSKPHDMLHVGQEVDVYVLNVDSERGRIGLSLKRLQPEPWSLVDEMYEEGQLVEGRVTNLTKFGAFVRMDGSDVEGLIHVSELSEEPVPHPREVLQKGDCVTAKIIRIDSQRRRIGLSLKGVDSPQQVAEDGAGDGQGVDRGAEEIESEIDSRNGDGG